MASVISAETFCIFADNSGAPLSSDRLRKKQAHFSGWVSADESLNSEYCGLWKWAEGEQRWVALVYCQSSRY